MEPWDQHMVPFLPAQGPPGLHGDTPFLDWVPAREECLLTPPPEKPPQLSLERAGGCAPSPVNPAPPTLHLLPPTLVLLPQKYIEPTLHIQQRCQEQGQQDHD